MYPRRGKEFINRISSDLDFRSKFTGYYKSTFAVLVRLGAPEPKPPIFFLDKIEKIQKALEKRSGWSRPAAK